MTAVMSLKVMKCFLPFIYFLDHYNETLKYIMPFNNDRFG